MKFFYYTSLGQIYFFTLAFICALAIWRGGKDLRLCGLAIASGFLADRCSLALIDNPAVLMVVVGIVDFLALLFVLSLTTSKVGQFIAFCFVAKIMMYISLVADFISFDTMAAWSELAGYGQLLVIAGGTLNADRGKFKSNYRASRVGSNSSISLGKKGVQDE